MFRFLTVVILSCLLSSPSAAQVKEIRRVLIFNELGASSPAVVLIDQQIRAAMDNSPYQIELYSEFLETALFPDQTTQQEFDNGISTNIGRVSRTLSLPSVRSRSGSWPKRIRNFSQGCQ